MADESAEPETTVQRGGSRGAQAKADEVKFSIEELTENARNFLDCSPHAVAGALEGSSKKSFTVDEAIKAVNRFLNREVDVDPASVGGES